MQAANQDESPSRYPALGAHTTKSQKSISMRKDSNSSLNTVQPNNGA